MKKLLVIVMAAFLLTSCDEALMFTEVDLRSVGDAIIEGVENENGYYLITKNKQQYVFINQGNVNDGEDATVLSDFTFDVNDNVLTIQFSETPTRDYSDNKLKRQMLYKMNGKADYETVQLKVNGEDVSFDGVFVE